jgi:(R,R)-butanediol dehydrogenase/meso-butanediol dehydrogenase/diacetyl reductase
VVSVVVISMSIKQVSKIQSTMNYMCGGTNDNDPLGSPISTPPLTLGHEFCGVVKQVPVGSKFTVGDKVIVDPTLTCHNCVPCSHGWESQCPGLSFLGLPGGPDGGLGELVTVNEYKLHKLPGNITLGDAALAEPLAVGLHAVRSAHVNGQEWRQKTILLFGAGPVGYAVLENLLAHGACPENIFVSEPSERKQRLLKAMGVRLLESKETGVEGQCLDLSQCMGADIAFICVGVSQAVGTAMSALRPRGTCINVAFWGLKVGTTLAVANGLTHTCLNRLNFHSWISSKRKSTFGALWPTVAKTSGTL